MEESLLGSRESLALAPGPTGSQHSWQQGGVQATLRDMKTEALNGIVVTLVEWKESQGRWRVSSHMDSSHMDVLPTKLVAKIKPRKQSFVAALAEGARKLSISAHRQPAALQVEAPVKSAAAASAQEVHRRKAEALANAWVRRPSVDAELTADELAAERAIVVPELARINEEAYMQSDAFMDRLGEAERRDDARRLNAAAQQSGAVAVDYA